MYSLVKRLLVGRPLSTAEAEHQRISKLLALPVFSSDAISSTAYAAEEILFVTAAAAGSSLALGLGALGPIAVGVAILLAIVVTSYRQTIYAYPTGGGSYVVSRENLGRGTSMVAGASLLVDYILTVAVSVSAGVAALISIPAFRDFAEHRVSIGLGLIALITVANLRGVKESGAVFALPTYTYVVLLAGLVGYGLVREFLLDPLPHVPFDPHAFEGALSGGNLGLFLILKGFSSGAVALTGIEAMADGVPVFRKPESKNAAITLTALAIILGSLFLGTAILANHLRPYPSHEQTVLSQMAGVVFGDGALYLSFQLATAGILVLAANTAYADFPRVASIIARDGFLPRQLANRGDRLVFSNGIVILAVTAGALLAAFGGITTALIPLYAVGVFTSFTLSQTGMVLYQKRNALPGWRKRATISAIGAFATGVVLIVVAVTKFTSGAWVPLVVVPSIIMVFRSIRRHYDRVNEALAITPEQVKPQAWRHTVVVLVGRIDRRALKALNYASSLRPDHIMALYIAQEEADREAIQAQWEDFGINVPLEIKGSPYRELVDPVEEFLDEIDERWHNDTVTVVIPEFVLGKGVAGKWLFENVLHNQSALALKLALLYRPNTVTTSVPFHVDYAAPGGDADSHPAGARSPSP